MLNSGLRGKRTKDSKGIVSVADQFNQQQYLIPTVTSFSITDESYVPLDDTAVDSAGGQTIVINGSGFAPGATVTVGGETISVVTFIDSGRLAFTAPAKISGSYTIFVTNSTGGTGILVPGLVYSGVPTFYTEAGSLGTLYETTSINKLVEASGDEPVTFSLASGSLPTGATLSANGAITGTSPVDSGSTTYSFTIKATDAENQDSLRSFSLTINTDVVTWSSPTADQAYSFGGGSAITDVTLSATSAAGYGVQYSANTLPTGLSLSGNSITGTPTVAETIYTQLTATANTTGRSATRTISWTISLGDSNWKYVSLLLNGATSSPTFINDASLNNSQLTIAGDTKPNNFSPYEEGYYSSYYGASHNNYLSIPSSSAYALSTNNFTIESWVYLQGASGASGQGGVIVGKWTQTGSAGIDWMLAVINPSTLRFYMNIGGTNVNFSASPTLSYNVWTHVAVVRNGSTFTLYINGVSSGTTTNAGSISNTDTTAIRTGIWDNTGSYINGYLSNTRVVNGTALYTSNFTPSTTPLTAVTNTVLLLHNSNRIVDTGVNNGTTTNANITVAAAHPFGAATTASYNAQYSTYFDGTGDYLDVGTPMSLSGDFTIEMWFKPDAVSKTYADLFTSVSANFELGLTTNSLVFWDSGSIAITHQTSVTDGVWHHVALTRSGTTVYLYLDGVRSSSSATKSTTYVPYRIATYATETFPGFISNLRVVSGTVLYSGATITVPTTALTAISGTQLLTCQDATLKDNSTNNFAITSAGQAKPVAVSPFTMTTSNTTVTSLGSAYFDGTGDYLSIPASPAFTFTGDFTIDGWVYPTALGADNCIISQWTTSLSFIFKVVTGNRLYFAAYPGSIVTQATSTVVPLNQWSHIAVIRTGTTIKLFVNGVQDTTTGTVSGSLAASTSPVTIGALDTVPSQLWTGYISDLRVIKGTALYTANFLPPQTPVAPVTNTQLLTCQYNGGATNNGFIDQSSFNNIITRPASTNATQGTFSPYSQTGWSNFYPALAYSTYATNPIGTFGTGTTFTVEGWVNMTVYPATNYHFSMLASCDQGSATYWAIGIGSTGKATVYWYDGNVKQCLGSTTLTRGTWYHVAIVVTSGVVTMYVDGNAETLTGTTTLTNPTGNASYTTGTERGASNGGSTGYISNLRTSTSAVYSEAFTPSSIPLVPAITSSVYATLLTAQDNVVIDKSPSNRTITSSSVTVQAFSPFGGITSVPNSYSNYFDGNGDYLTLATNPAFAIGTADFTLECWVMPIGANLPWGTIFAGVSFGASSDWGLYSGDSTTSLYPTFYFTGSGTPGSGTSQTQGSQTLTAYTPLTIDQWNHIAVSRVSGTARMFINGEQTGPSLNASTWSLTNVLQKSVAGGFNGNSNTLFTGNISNLRIISGTGLYTDNFTPSTSPLTAVAGTILLTCQSNTIVDNSINNFALTAFGNSTPKPFNPFGYTNTTGVGYSPSVNGGSIYFDGNGDSLNTDTLTSATFGTRDFTIEFWAYPTVNSRQDWFDASNGVAANRLLLYYDGTNINYYAAASVRITGTPMALNRWQHIALCRSAGSTKLFLNGTQIGNTYNDTINYPAQPFYIGRDSAGSTYVSGYMSDIRVAGEAIYKSNFVPPVQPLSATVNTKLLLNGTTGGIVDAHGTNVLETVGHTTLASEDPYGGSYYSNYISSATKSVWKIVGAGTPLELTDDFTVEFWMNLSDMSVTYMHVLNNSGGNGDALKLQLSGGLARFYFTNGTTYTYTPYNIQGGKWYHVVWERSGTSSTIFLNGVRQTVFTTMTATVNYSTNLFWGSGTSSEVFYGSLSNLRIIKGQCLYDISQSTLEVPTSPLTAISGTSLLTCQSNKFKDNSVNNYTITLTDTPRLIKSMNPFQNNTGKSLYFDGTGDSLLVYNNPNINLGLDSFTLECWAYFNNVSNEMVLINKGWQSSSAYASYLIYMNNTGSLRFGSSSNGGAWDIANEKVIGTMTAGKWTHIAVTRDGNTFRAYIDGVINDTFTFTSSSALASISAQTLYIGGRTGGTSSMNGYLKDVRITKGVARTITVPTAPYGTK